MCALSVETESGFMACSVRVSNDVQVEKWHDFFGTDDDPGFKEIGFDD